MRLPDAMLAFAVAVVAALRSTTRSRLELTAENLGENMLGVLQDAVRLLEARLTLVRRPGDQRYH